MLEHGKILVPLDFSETGQYALQAAQKFARLFDGSITPFHVYVPVSNAYDTDFMEMDTFQAPMPDVNEMEEVQRNNLRKMVEQQLSANWATEPMVSVGSPASAIVEAADDFDLIVMGSHGRSGFSRFFLGSVSDKVLRTSHIPVLTVSKAKQLKGFDHIMLGTDFSDHSTRAFPLVIEIAQKANSEVELVHIINFKSIDNDEPQQETIERRRKRLEVMAKQKLAVIDHLLETKIIVSSATTHEALLNENLNNPHDLIVLSTVGHTGIEYLMMGSTTSNVVRHVKSPVLSVNPKQKTVKSEGE